MTCDVDNVLQVLGRYARRIDRRSISAVSRRSGFSGAGVWKVETPTVDWAVRLWPSHGLKPQRILGLHRLLEHVQRHGVDVVAVPIPADDGSTLVVVPDNGAVWQVEPWLPGAADFHACPTETRLRHALAALARWHQAAATHVPDERSCEWFASLPKENSPAVLERYELTGRWSRDRLTRLARRVEGAPDGERRTVCLDLIRRLPRLLPLAEQELAALRAERFALQPCLRDVWHDHVLFVGERVTGLIDPSACRTENVAADLARLIGSLAEDDANLWSTALDEYRRHRPLSMMEEWLIGVLDRSGVVLSAATWLEWIYVDERPFAPLDEAVLGRLRHWQRRVAKLDASW